MKPSANIKLFIVAGLLAGLALAIFVSPFANPNPDGLEKVAEEEGFIEAADDHTFADGPLADYGFEGIDGGAGTSVAGIIGTLLTFAVMLALVALVRTLRRPDADPTASDPGSAATTTATGTTG